MTLRNFLMAMRLRKRRRLFEAPDFRDPSVAFIVPTPELVLPDIDEDELDAWTEQLLIPPRPGTGERNVRFVK